MNFIFIYTYSDSRHHSDRNKTEQFLRMLVELTMNNLETFFDFDEIKGSDYLSVSFLSQ